MNGEPSTSIPHVSSSGSNEIPGKVMINEQRIQKRDEPQVQQVNSFVDLDASQELTGGMLKIVPSDVDVSVILLIVFS